MDIIVNPQRDSMGYRLMPRGVIRLFDGAFIPENPALASWRRYLKWAETHTPLPDEDTPIKEQKQIELLAVREEIGDNLPSWTQVKTVIDQAFPIQAQNGVITRLARAVYFLFKNSGD